MNHLTTATLLAALAACASTGTSDGSPRPVLAVPTTTMELGNFSVSLAVADLAASRAFYEKLGFQQAHGEDGSNYVIMQNGTTTIGLFQGMFEANILTFNPGRTRDAEPLDTFTDVRELQRRVQAAGITPVSAADPATTGPANFVIVDPDGNTIFFDQHVPAPKR